MNPRRADCLKHDPSKAETVLRQAYSSMLEAFWGLVKGGLRKSASAVGVSPAGT